MVQYTVQLEPAVSRGVARLSTGLPPPPSDDLGGGEVRGQSLLVVSAGVVGTFAVEIGKEWLARGMQNPPPTVPRDLESSSGSKRLELCLLGGCLQVIQ